VRDEIAVLVVSSELAFVRIDYEEPTRWVIPNNREYVDDVRSLLNVDPIHPSHEAVQDDAILCRASGYISRMPARGDNEQDSELGTRGCEPMWAGGSSGRSIGRSHRCLIRPMIVLS
jgi:hypothetical protein